MGTYRYLVRGRVQGVGYRYFALKRAEQLRLSGFVRNMPDGSVEVIAEGPDPLLSEFERSLNEGPSFARVEAVERLELEPRGDSGFHIR
jgi:acylphosphatase